MDWFPWGEEAFAKARAEDKPIFLSVGYSTCHWCHVMERESFEDDEVAAALAKDFIAVKVDREERPDVDALYMDATQALTGRGGWPNSVWLFPDGAPFFAGTYYPRGQFLTLLSRITELWKNQRPRLEAGAAHIKRGLGRAGTPTLEGAGGPLDRSLVDEALAERWRRFDRGEGGFGGAPKFPPHTSIELLVSELEAAGGAAPGDPQVTPAARPGAMLRKTLDAMARGGIRDHVGGGFHRYATDGRWFLPHFEKMLYDNALLLGAYARASEVLEEPEMGTVARELVAWVRREMQDPAGGFYSALDADSEGEEGKFYLWTRAELDEVLTPDQARTVATVYGATAAGNHHDEATRRATGKNVLFLPRPLSAAAASLAVDLPTLRADLASGRSKLLAAREERERPHLDDKVVVSWNGLMIGALASAGAALGERGWVQAAARAADFVLGLRDEQGRLLRSWRAGEGRVLGYLEDHAFLARGLLDLHEASGDSRWLREASSLVDAMQARFADPEGGGFFTTSQDHEELLVRTKRPLDSALPSANGVAAQVLVRLARAQDRPERAQAARGILEAFRPLMARYPQATASLVAALGEYLRLPERLRDPETVGPGRAAVRLAPVTAQVSAGPADDAGARRVTVTLTIDEGWHLNSTRPRQEFLVPTTLALASGPEGASLDEVRFPAPVSRALSFDPQPLDLYEGRIEVTAQLRGAPRAADLTLRFQACDEWRCLEPKQLELAVPAER